MLILAVVAIICASVGLMAMTPEDRASLRDNVREALQPVAAEIARSQAATEPFRTALRARTQWAIAAPAIIALNVLVFTRMIFGPLPIAHPETLISWGANSGPLTTNGEWWRLVTSLFVHASVFHLLADLAGLAGVARLIERMAGPIVLVGVYGMAGVIGGLLSLSESPLSVNVGSSPAVFGLFGLLLALTAWSHYERAELRVPLVVFRALAPTAAIFLLYTFAVKGFTSAPNLAGLLVGIGAGTFLGRGVGERAPAPREAAIAVGVCLLLAAGYGFALRGIVDVRQDVMEVIAIEERTATPYRAAVRKYIKGEVKTGALAELISGTIMPELEAARVRVAGLTNVHEQQRALVKDAEEYLRLRAESWRLRREALQKSSTQILREADTTERASLQALDRLRARPFTLIVRS